MFCAYSEKEADASFAVTCPTKFQVPVNTDI